MGKNSFTISNSQMLDLQGTFLTTFVNSCDKFNAEKSTMIEALRLYFNYTSFTDFTISVSGTIKFNPTTIGSVLNSLCDTIVTYNPSITRYTDFELGNIFPEANSGGGLIIEPEELPVGGGGGGGLFIDLINDRNAAIAILNAAALANLSAYDANVLLLAHPLIQTAQGDNSSEALDLIAAFNAANTANELLLTTANAVTGIYVLAGTIADINAAKDAAIAALNACNTAMELFNSKIESYSTFINGSS